MPKNIKAPNRRPSNSAKDTFRLDRYQLCHRQKITIRVDTKKVYRYKIVNGKINSLNNTFSIPKIIIRETILCFHDTSSNALDRLKIETRKRICHSISLPLNIWTTSSLKKSTRNKQVRHNKMAVVKGRLAREYQTVEAFTHCLLRWINIERIKMPTHRPSIVLDWATKSCLWDSAVIQTPCHIVTNKSLLICE